MIVNGADPRKILLMTFSRRAAAEMARRVERIARRVIGNNAGVMTHALWAGTFHGCLLGEHHHVRHQRVSACAYLSSLPSGSDGISVYSITPLS